MTLEEYIRLTYQSKETKQVLAVLSSIEPPFEVEEETFSQALLRYIDAKGLTDVECYKKAFIDRKLFSKIRSNTNYKPSKKTALLFAIALELTIDETEDLLERAGFTLSHSILSDVIIEYFITEGKYDMNEINDTLEKHGQKAIFPD